MKILHINACVRKNSRTKILSKYLLDKLNGDIEEVNLNQLNLLPLINKTLCQRDELIKKQDFNSYIFDYAKQFSKADIIVISAPYWDLSFPAILKTYIENINVLGITFNYTDKGIPQGLCKAKKLYYITTAGGEIISDEFGFGYIKNLANILYGIDDVKYIKAQNLDIFGADINQIIENTKLKIDKLFE